MSAHPTIPADPKKAFEILMECYGEGAGAEALFRSFLRERDSDRDGAEFWLEVYGLIAGAAS
jgi:hypothetical protein